MKKKNKDRSGYDRINVGKGWDRPRWKQILLWIRWRPYYKFMGWQYDLRYKTADKIYKKYHRDFPLLRIQTWVGKPLDLDNPWESFIGEITEVHYGPTCTCTNPTITKEEFGFPHNIIWIPSSDYTWVGDKWYGKDQKFYKLDGGE